MVGVVKSCCQHSLQDVYEPSPATVPSQASSPDKQRAHGAASPGTGDGSRVYRAVSLSGAVLEPEKHPPNKHTHTQLLPHSLPQPQPAPVTLQPERGHSPGSGWDSRSSPGTHGHAGWKQVESSARAGCPCQGSRRAQ